jgi:hypothetical protein
MKEGCTDCDLELGKKESGQFLHYILTSEKEVALVIIVSSGSTTLTRPV